MTGKHIRRKKHILRFVIGILVVGLGIFCYFHFCDDQEIDHQQYLISIAGVIDSNKGLKKGNRIYIYYEGKLDVKNKDIQNVKVRSYKVLD